MPKPFRKMWGTQTTLGKKYGLSAVRVGKILIEKELKDPTTKGATEKALREGYAVSTPLKDGTPFYMWHMGRFRGLVDEKPLDPITLHVNEVLAIYLEADSLLKAGLDKAARLTADIAYDRVPQKLLEEVKARVEAVKN